jgi:RNA polymerase sigma-32 factor
MGGPVGRRASRPGDDTRREGGVRNRRKALASALSALNDRERRIFEARRLAEEPITLNELANEFGVSRERVRQISVCAFEKVQKSVKNRVAVMETPVRLPAH